LRCVVVGAASCRREAEAHVESRHGQDEQGEEPTTMTAARAGEEARPADDEAGREGSPSGSTLGAAAGRGSRAAREQREGDEDGHDYGEAAARPISVRIGTLTTASAARAITNRRAGEDDGRAAIATPARRRHADSARWPARAVAGDDEQRVVDRHCEPSISARTGVNEDSVANCVAMPTPSSPIRSHQGGQEREAGGDERAERDDEDTAAIRPRYPPGPDGRGRAQSIAADLDGQPGRPSVGSDGLEAERVSS